MEAVKQPYLQAAGSLLTLRFDKKKNGEGGELTLAKKEL
jgi:hypothetical protein